MRSSLMWILMGSLVFTVGCGSGTKDPTNPRGTDPYGTNPDPKGGTNPVTPDNNNNNNGDTCQNGAQKCEGMNLTFCQNGKWATNTCDHLCQQAGLGQATGCMHDNQKGYETCFCADTNSSGKCTDGEQKCNGMTLSVCQNGAWSTSSCDFLCQQAGHGPAQSCGFDNAKGAEICFCGTPPSGCQNGEQKCQGTNLSTCQNNGWQTQSCTDLCHAGGMGRAQSCGFDSGKGLDTCFCYSGLIGDPCLGAADCKDGVCNAAGWCAKACNHDGDCGNNTLGQINHCMETQAGGGACFPWCNSNPDCAAYPGTVCQQKVMNKSGVVVNGVCAVP